MVVQVLEEGIDIGIGERRSAAACEQAPHLMHEPYSANNGMEEDIGIGREGRMGSYGGCCSLASAEELEGRGSWQHGHHDEVRNQQQ
ncbi:Os04g0649050 [Oryza sativa Japonica Group]|uniref:Os04g0649050 protein n=1 Tax=Oryza sativa subsp. japonica TaxID=39947 RepID=A0A0P0WFL4_ORYSJ|nr:Os04g0649050 [Oryza sativa Japonica Group]